MDISVSRIFYFPSLFRFPLKTTKLDMFDVGSNATSRAAG